MQFVMNLRFPFDIFLVKKYFPKPYVNQNSSEQFKLTVAKEPAGLLTQIFQTLFSICLRNLCFIELGLRKKNYSNDFYGKFFYKWAQSVSW